MKILAPVGNMESLEMAVYNGADEVYLGINSFNARNNIDGFTIDSLKNAVDFAHLFGVKVFLAINILFSNNELQSAVDIVVDSYNLGVDAFIIQDLGLASILAKNYPKIILHASTQMGIHNLEGVKEIEKFNFKRVVLARETPLEEIKRIRANCDIEIEYFVHGALCVSFSGNCYLSSYLFSASGNRGRCKQLCRLPFSLRLKDKTIKKGYLLSAKDFDMTKRLVDLKEAGVTSIKIEGRARRPFYVAMATRCYYNALNNIAFDKQSIELAFNRNYTEGYFNGNSGIISKTQSHIGIEIGRVEKVNLGKKFNEIFINSHKPISKKSVLKFFDGDEEFSLITAYDVKKCGNNKYIITTTQKIKQGLTVRLILDNALEEQTLLNTKKRQLDIRLVIGQNKKILANVTPIKDGESQTITIEGEVLQPAQTKPISESEIIECFNKNKYFDVKLSFDTFEKVFIAKSQLNEFRRKVFETTFYNLVLVKREKLEKIKVKIHETIKEFSDFYITSDLDFNCNEQNVIYSPESYLIDDVLRFNNLCKEKGKNGFLDLPNFALEKDVKLLKEIIEKTKVGVVANNYYALSFTDKMVIGSALNVYNNESANVLDRPFMSAENSEYNKTEFAFMTLRHCPMKEHLNCTCENCKYQDGYEYLLDKKVMKLKRKKLSTCTFYLVK